ncbi:MAG TPA: Asp23/Gls24 family envelope stress response protein [Planctomycetota bacterium]|nr:Asp23/Gls24 family envelope stress response protein [Planctomycetota bacterium]
MSKDKTPAPEPPAQPDPGRGAEPASGSGTGPAADKNELARSTGREIEKRSDGLGRESVGRVSIEDPVYFEIAYREARSVPGVVDVKGTFFEMLTGHAKGVHVKTSDTAVILELRMALEYGRYIPDVVIEVRKRIANAIRRMTDREVRAIKVTIDRLVEGYDLTDPMSLDHDEESEHIDF